MPTYNLDEFTLDQLQQNEIEAYNNKDQQALQRWQQLKKDKQQRLNYLATQRENDSSALGVPGLGTVFQTAGNLRREANSFLAENTIWPGNVINSATDFGLDVITRIPRASAQAWGQFQEGLNVPGLLISAKMPDNSLYARSIAERESRYDPITYPPEQLEQRTQQLHEQQLAKIQKDAQSNYEFIDRNTLPNNTKSDEWANAIAQAPAQMGMSAVAGASGPLGQLLYFGITGLGQAYQTLRSAGVRDKDMDPKELAALTVWNAATERLGDVGAGLGSKLTSKGSNLLQQKLAGTAFGKTIADYMTGATGGNLRRGIAQGAFSEFLDSALQDLASDATILAKTKNISYPEAILTLATNSAWIKDNLENWSQQAAAGGVGAGLAVKIQQQLEKNNINTEDIPFHGPRELPPPPPSAGLLPPPPDNTAPLAGERESVTGESLPQKPAKFRSGFDIVRPMFQDSAIPLDYYNTVIYLESGGNPNAKNKQPGQTAGGIGGITIGTWNSAIKAAGLDPKDLKRDNVQDQALVLRFVTEQNEEALKKFNQLKGIGGGDPTPANYQRYLAHHFGVSGAMEIMNAAEGRTIRGEANPVLIGEIIGENAVSKNPWLAPNGKQLTAKQVVETIANKFSATPENLKFAAQFPRVWNKERLGSVYGNQYNRDEDLASSERMLKTLELINRPAPQPEEFVPEEFQGITPEIPTQPESQTTDVVPPIQAQPPFIGEANLPAQQKLQEQIQLVQQQRAREQAVPAGVELAGNVPLAPSPAPVIQTPEQPQQTRAQKKLAKATAPAKAQVAKFDAIELNDVLPEQAQPESVPSLPMSSIPTQSLDTQFSQTQSPEQILSQTEQTIPPNPINSEQTQPEVVTPEQTKPTPQRKSRRTSKSKGIVFSPEQQTPSTEFDFGPASDNSAEVASVPNNIRDIIVYHGGKDFARPTREGMLRSLGGGAGDYWQGVGFYGSDLEQIGKYYKKLNQEKKKKTELLDQADDFSATFDGFESEIITDELRNIAHTKALSSWPEYKATWEDIENKFDLLRTDKDIKNYLIENPHLTDEFILEDARSRFIQSVERAINKGLNNYPSDFYHYYFSWIPIDLVYDTLIAKNLPSMVKSFPLRKDVPQAERKTALHKFNWDIKQQELMRLDKKFEDQSEFVQNAILDKLNPAELDSLFAPISSAYSKEDKNSFAENLLKENIFKDYPRAALRFENNFKKIYGRNLTTNEMDALKTAAIKLSYWGGNKYSNFSEVHTTKLDALQKIKEPELEQYFFQLFYPDYSPTKEWQKHVLRHLSGMTLYERLGVYNGAETAINQQKAESDHEPWIATSNLLYNIGIRGNQYPTKYDWNKSDPDKKFNYVIFNPDELEPISKSYDALKSVQSLLLKNKAEPTAEEIDALQTHLQSILDRLAPGVKATPARALTENNPMQTEYGMDGLPKFISFATSLVEDTASASNYLYHEVVHAIFPKLSPNERSALLERARRKWREKYGIDERYTEKDLNQSELDEEAIAEALRDYATNAVATEKPIRNIFDRILNLFRNFGKWLKKTGWAISDHKATSTFDKILEGEIGRRPYPSEALAAVGEEANLRAEQTGRQQWIEQNLATGEYTFSTAYKKTPGNVLVGNAFGYGEPIQWSEGYDPNSEQATSRSMQILFAKKSQNQTEDLAERFRHFLFSGVDPLAALGRKVRNSLYEDVILPMSGEKSALDNRLLVYAKRYARIKNITQQDTARINDYLLGQAPLSSLRNDLQSLMKEVRDYYDNVLTPRAVKLGLISKETAAAGKGNYMHRAYPFLKEVNKLMESGQYRGTGGGIANNLLRASPLNETKKRKLGNSPEDMHLRELYGEQTDDPFSRMLYTAALVGHDVIQLEYAGRMLGLAGDGIWKDSKIEIPGRGEVPLSRLQTEVEWLSAHSDSINTTQQQELQQYNTILANLSPPAEIRSRYQQVPDSKRYGGLRNLWVSNELAPFILGAQDVKSEMGKTWQEYVALWKLKNVAFNVFSYFRNMTTAIGMGWGYANTSPMKLAWMNPSSEVARNFTDLLLNMVNPVDKPLPAWMKSLHDNGIATGTYASAELAGIFAEANKIDGNVSVITKMLRTFAGKSIAEQSGKFVNFIQNFYGLFDVAFKITIAKDLMDKGKSQQEAIRIAQDAIFDYSNVSQQFNSARKNTPIGAPFITFGVKSLDLVYKMAMDRTGVPGARKRLALLAGTPVLLSLLAAAKLELLGDSDDDGENDYLQVRKNLYPNYRYNPLTVLIPFLSEHAPGFQFVDLSAASPLGPLAQMVSTGISAAKQKRLDKTAEELFSGVNDFGVLTGPLYDLAGWLLYGMDSSTQKPINPPNASPETKFKNNLIYGLNHFVLPPMLALPHPEKNQPGGAMFRFADAVQTQAASMLNNMLGTDFEGGLLANPGMFNPVTGTRKLPPLVTSLSYALGGTALKVNPDETTKYETLQLKSLQKDLVAQLYRLKFLETRTGIDPSAVEEQRQYLYTELKRVRDQIKEKTLRDLPEEKYTSPKFQKD